MTGLPPAGEGWAGRLLWMAIGLAVLQTVAWWRATPSITSDSSWGLLTVENHLSGGGWNRVKMADNTDLRHDSEDWISWWTPGQHMVPEFFARVLGMRVGGAVKATVLLCLAASYSGWLLLLRRLTGRPAVAAFSLLVIMSSRYATESIFEYHGGEALLLAYFPWFLLLWTRAGGMKKASLRWLAMAGLVLAGLLIKYTFVAPALAILAWEGWEARRSGDCGKFFSGLAALMAGSLLFYFMFVVRGPTPAGTSSFSFSPDKILFPFAGSFLAMADLESLLNRIFRFPGGERLSPSGMTWMDLGLLIFLIPYLFMIVRRGGQGVPAGLYRLCVAMVVVFTVIMLALYLRGSSVSLEARHFRICGVLLIPLFLMFFLRRSGWRSRLYPGAVLVVFLFLPAAYGTASVVDKAFFRRQGFISPDTGIRHDHLDRASFDRLKLLFGSPDHRRDDVMYVTSPEIALEFSGVRKVVVHADFVGAEELAGHRYHGPVRVLLVIPRFLEDNGKGKLIRRAFVDVRKWEQLNNPGGDCVLWLGASADAGGMDREVR